MPVTKNPGSTLTVTLTIPYSGSGGNFTAEIALTDSAGTVRASGSKDFAITAATAGSTTQTLTATISSAAATGDYTLHIAIWDKPKGTTEKWYGAVSDAVTIYATTIFGTVTAAIS